MSAWFCGKNSNEMNRLTHEIPNCGTAACIAGWAVSIDFFERNKKKVQPSEVVKRVTINRCSTAQILDISIEQGERLFFSQNWPAPWTCPHKQFDQLPPEERAKAAVARIEHFIATEGRE